MRRSTRIKTAVVVQSESYENDSDSDGDKTMVEKASTECENMEENSSPSKNTRKRSSRIAVGIPPKYKVLEELCFNLKEAIRGAFNCVDQELTPFKHQAKAIFVKLESIDSDEIDTFLNDLAFRLNFVVSDIEPTVKRHNVYTTIVESALLATKETHVPSSVISFLVTYCKKFQNADDIAVRYNICVLVGIIFKIWPSTFEEGQEDNEVLTSRERDALYNVCHTRRLDRNPQVRGQALIALRAIQDIEIDSDFKLAIELGPKDIIFQGLLDREEVARMSAIEAVTFDLNCKDQIENLFDIVTCDKHLNVRARALKEFADLNLCMLTKYQLRDLLQSVLFDTEEEVRHVAKSVLLKGWIYNLTAQIKAKLKRRSKKHNINLQSESNYGLGAGLMSLISKLPWKEESDTVASFVFCAFDMLRAELACSYEKPLKVSELLFILREDEIPPVPFMRWNCDELKKHELPGKQMALGCFYWRCTIEYSYKHTAGKHDTVERTSCEYRIAPTLKELAEIARSVRILPGFKGFSSDSEELTYLEMMQLSFKEIIKSMPFLEQDECGLVEWRNVLEEALLDFTTKKEVTDLICQQLAKFIYPDNPHGAFEAVVNAIAQLVEKDINPDATIMNETLTPVRPLAVEVNEVITYYCMQATHSILQTGVVKVVDALVQDKYDNLITKSIRSTDPIVRSWALECVGIISILDEGILAENASMIFRGFLLDCLTMRTICLNIFVDWTIQLGYEKITRMPCLGHRKLLQVLLMYLEDGFDNKDGMFENTLLCVSKLLLHCSQECPEDPWDDLLLKLTIWTFDPQFGPNVKIRSCLSQFFVVFCTTRVNQLLMLRVFRKLFDLRPTHTVKLILPRDLLLSLKMLCGFTKRTLLVSEEERKLPSLHLKLARDLIRYIINNRTHAKLFEITECLLCLEYEQLPKDDLVVLFGDLSKAYSAILYMGERARPVNHLRRIGKKFVALQGDMIRESHPIPEWD